MEPAPTTPEGFGERLRRFRMACPDPEHPEHAISQRALSLLLLCRVKAVHEYERGIRMPHPLIRRELERYFPGLYDDRVKPPPPLLPPKKTGGRGFECHADRQ